MVLQWEMNSPSKPNIFVRWMAWLAGAAFLCFSLGPAATGCCSTRLQRLLQLRARNQAAPEIVTRLITTVDWCHEQLPKTMIVRVGQHLTYYGMPSVMVFLLDRCPSLSYLGVTFHTETPAQGFWSWFGAPGWEVFVFELHPPHDHRCYSRVVPI